MKAWNIKNGIAVCFGLREKIIRWKKVVSELIEKLAIIPHEGLHKICDKFYLKLH
jgi:hypothetical protein